MKYNTEVIQWPALSIETMEAWSTSVSGPEASPVQSKTGLQLRYRVPSSVVK
jgi:hypothetical protein